MKRIDRETVQRIIDAADIVDVVSDFVSLKKRGANYIGLCPFHNERTPSFSVSRAKGYCKCFSCGKGGSAVSFIMEHENFTYYEALKYLAKKYHIEVKEREETDAEREASSQRESMFAVNEFAQIHFRHNLTETADGQDIGLAYFRERGINDQMIEKFKLGYALDKSDDLLKAALAKGYSEKYLIETGLCSKSEKGAIYDRFRGRVIYPVHSVSGRVVAFGGRTLRSDKSVAKYVNSPESAIYKKSNELYGLYQAKSSIMKRDKCILVEGYMDVISMHQAGVDNVVASSGTSLTDGQVRLIHRFTKNVTVIYDSDPAGIKASLRGIDMLLAEGLDIKVLLLPEGDDPDSFSQSHSSTEVEEYIANHEEDFMRFKTRVLLADAGADPIQRARVINDIVKSISVIPDPVTRTVYLQECSRMLQIDERVLSIQLGKSMAENAERQQKSEEARKAREKYDTTEAQTTSDATDPPAPLAPIAQTKDHNSRKPSRVHQKLVMPEVTLTKYIVKYGLLPLEGTESTVLDFIVGELSADEIEFTDPVCRSIVNDSLHAQSETWPGDKAEKKAKIDLELESRIKEGLEEIRLEGKDLADMEAKERELREYCESQAEESMRHYSMQYLEEIFLSSPDDDQRRLATVIVADKYQLSKVHTKYAHVETEEERLPELVYRAVMELKYAILDMQIDELNAQMKAQPKSSNSSEMLQRIFELYQLKSQFSKILGDRIVNPK